MSNGLHIGSNLCIYRTPYLVIDASIQDGFFHSCKLAFLNQNFLSEFSRKRANCLEVWKNCVNTHTHRSRAYSINNFLKTKHLAKSFLSFREFVVHIRLAPMLSSQLLRERFVVSAQLGLAGSMCVLVQMQYLIQ